MACCSCHDPAILLGKENISIQIHSPLFSAFVLWKTLILNLLPEGLGNIVLSHLVLTNCLLETSRGQFEVVKNASRDKFNLNFSDLIKAVWDQPL